MSSWRNHRSSTLTIPGLGVLKENSLLERLLENIIQTHGDPWERPAECYTDPINLKGLKVHITTHPRQDTPRRTHNFVQNIKPKDTHWFCCLYFNLLSLFWMQNNVLCLRFREATTSAAEVMYAEKLCIWDILISGFRRKFQVNKNVPLRKQNRQDLEWKKICRNHISFSISSKVDAPYLWEVPSWTLLIPLEISFRCTYFVCT